MDVKDRTKLVWNDTLNVLRSVSNFTRKFDELFMDGKTLLNFISVTFTDFFAYLKTRIGLLSDAPVLLEVLIAVVQKIPAETLKQDPVWLKLINDAQQLYLFAIQTGAIKKHVPFSDTLHTAQLFGTNVTQFLLLQLRERYQTYVSS